MSFLLRIILLTLLLSSFATKSDAQNFAWTSTVVHTDIEFSMNAMSVPRQELCVGGHGDQLSYRYNDAVLYNGAGETQADGYELERDGDFMFVYSFDGALKWYYHFWEEQAVLEGFSYDNKNRLTALVIQSGEEENDYYDEEEDDEGEVVAPKAVTPESFSGYCLYYFDSQGKIARRICIPNLLEVDITDFKTHPSGGFVIAGHADEEKVAANLPLTTGHGGSDFLLYIDSTGNIIWGDVLSYQKESCCTYGAEPKVVVDDKGKVYLGGSYMGGARFGGKVIRLAPVPYNAGKYYNAEEAYVAAYSPTGEFLWVNTGGVQSRFSSLAVGGGYVYVATTASRTGDLFGEKLDTADHQRNFVTVFDAKGKFKRHISTGGGSHLLLAMDAKNNLVVTGTIGIETGYLARPDSLAKDKWRREDTFIAFYSPGGKFKKCFLANMLKIQSDAPPVCMPISSEQFFLCGDLFASMAIPLRALDKGFPDVKFSASAAFIGRWK